MHSEAGIWKQTPFGISLLISQASGVSEISEGHAKDNVLTVDSSSIARGDLVPLVEGKACVTAVRRIFKLSDDGNTLDYQVFMATDHTPDLTLHLEASLKRQEE